MRYMYFITYIFFLQRKFMEGVSGETAYTISGAGAPALLIKPVRKL